MTKKARKTTHKNGRKVLETRQPDKWFVLRAQRKCVEFSQKSGKLPSSDVMHYTHVCHNTTPFQTHKHVQVFVC